MYLSVFFVKTSELEGRYICGGSGLFILICIIVASLSPTVLYIYGDLCKLELTGV